MHKYTFLTWLIIVALLIGLLPASAAPVRLLPVADAPGTSHTVNNPQATIIIDGVHETAWGNPLASDPLGDMTEPNVDLHRLYVTEDADSYYIGFDAYASSWGMAYGIYIDTDLINGSGATTDPWGRAVDAISAHRPEYALYVWHRDNDTLEEAQLIHWNGTSWDYSTLISRGGEQGYGAANDWLEYKIPKAALITPTQMALEVFTTGGCCHAQDSVPSDPNVAYTNPDWGSATTTLSAFALFPPPPISLEVTWPPEGYFFATSDIQVTGVVSPALGVTVTVNLNNAEVYTPTLDASGHFTQPLTLAQCNNTITVTAASESNAATIARHVIFGACHDNNVLWDGLYHDSRDEVYRHPFGAVPAGTPVTLRLRAFKDDLTGARLRVVDDVRGSVSSYPMHLAASDGTYDYWEYTLPTDHATLLWYRFEAIDGAARAYYGDQGNWWSAPWTKGGEGLASGSATGVGSFQLTVYLPDFTTPDWLQNGVIYQIFPERFRNGNPANDVISGTFFYGDDEPWGTPQVYTGAVAHTTWNEEIYDPRQVGGPYFSAYSNQFYGGDLQGVIDKLDYLRDAGFTVLYFNPIFTSPSNHKYDGTTYEEIDPALGDLATFTRLITETQARGMHIILDGVFNHTSSDSVYFDKYSRYTTTGAYESQGSPYYDWYFFTEWPDNYNAWWGFKSLPKLNSANPEVRSYIYSGTNPIATRWIISDAQRLASGWRFDVAGDIDPGYSNAPDNGYWVGFRQAVRAVYSQTAMISEEWGNASQYLLGNQMDSTMNYRFRNALLGFIRDSGWSDTNTSFPHQTPSQFFETIKSLQEDYPAPAWYAMMNLVGTHDTNRVRFVMRESGDVTETVDARQQLMALAQYSLPGAPTVYYADEVGASADGKPCSTGSTTMCGDPYNRLPFPWDDTPGFYVTRTGMLEYYTTLGDARHSNTALRTGSLDLLYADDDNDTLAYGRKGDGDAAIALFNRSATTQPLTLDLTGFLPAGTVLTDVLSSQVYTTSFHIVLGSNQGALLITSNVPHAPEPPANLTASEGNGQVSLTWDAVTGAASYNVYRSLLSGGAYTRVATYTAGTIFTDTTVTNGTLYYYVVTAVDSGLQESGYSNEASARPHANIGWAGNLSPASIVHTIGLTPTGPITAQVWVDGVTNPAGQGAGITAQLGYGISGTTPSGWTAWTPMNYSGDVGNNDAYSATLTPEMTGTFQYVARFSTTGGRDWTYTGLGDLTVNVSTDIAPPDAPTHLRLAHWGIDHLALAWDAPSATDVYAYDLHRATATEADVAIARILSPTLVYTDETVATGVTYTYTVVALDASFNFSSPSNEVAGTPRQRTVTVTFNVTVPAFTPANATICIPGDNARIMGSTWDPSTLPMTKVDDTHWTKSIVADDGVHLQYKYTRCASWDVVEWWGDITGFTNRQLDIVYGATGVQIVNDSVGNWRDPLVIDKGPLPGATGVLTTTVITATWSRALDVTTVNTATFKLASPAGPVVGAVNYISQTNHYETVFTPTAPLDYGTRYTATLGTAIRGVNNGDATLQRSVGWSFTTVARPTYTVFLPIILKNW